MKFIIKENPDIILLMEVDKKWINKLQRLQKEYPFQVRQTLSNDFGISLYSRKPLEWAKIIYFGKAGLPSVEARVTINGKTITLIGTHPLPPVSKIATSLRDAQLDEIARHIKELSTPVILMGDLNTSPWSYSFKRLTKTANLKETGKEFGIKPTWPAIPILDILDVPIFDILVPVISLLGIPIDHILVSQGIWIKKTMVGNNLGSDHRPVIADLHF